MSYKRLPDDALDTIYNALGRDFSNKHFGMPAQNSNDQRALVAADRRQSRASSPRNRPETCVCTAWICEHKTPPCYVAEGTVTSKRGYSMCDFDEDKDCSFESIILAILAAARRVIADKAPQADRIVIFNDKNIKRSHARHGMNKESPILSIDLLSRSEILVWYGTRVWFCAKTYGLIEKNGRQKLVLHREEPCARRPEFVNEHGAFVPAENDWQRAAIQTLVHKGHDLLLASREGTSSHEKFKGYIFLRKRKRGHTSA